MFREAFAEAVRDYYLFINRGYPTKGVLKLVGDRFRLSGEERNILYRGVTSKEVSERRRARRLPLPEGVCGGATITVDGHNVLFTLVNYLQGRTSFIAVDGYLRDSGNPTRRVRAGGEFDRAARELGSYLRALEPTRITVVFDEPVTYSKDHIGHVRALWEELGLWQRSELVLVPSADQAVKESAADVLVTSDSTLIDATTAPIADVARWIVEREFEADLASLRRYLQPC
ncbi:MAG: DUF434 domain-containing protein [Spirochaetota bacterium]